MKNEALIAVKDDRNDIKVKMKFKFNGNEVACRAKIDTGCQRTCIPIRRLKLFSDEEILLMKEKDILSKVDSRISYGVETGGTYHKKPESFDEKMKCSGISFRHRLEGVYLNKLDLGNKDVYFNYNRTGNVLIGMDILEELDIRMGMSESSNKYILVAKLLGDKNSNYEEKVNKYLKKIELDEIEVQSHLLRELYN